MYSSEYKLETQDVSLIKVPSALSSVYSISKNNVSDRPYLSVIIPLLNEEENIFDLYNKLYNTLSKLRIAYEIIFIDDGSTDNTFQRIKSIPDDRVRIVRFQRNYGKAAALSCGFRKSRGKVAITMDGDLQDDPKEIPRFLEKLKEFDMVSGWKGERHDPFSKTIPSRFFNKLTRCVTGVKLNDFNCGYKAYRSEVVKNINLYGEFHRYIPILAHWKGYTVGEIKVEHHPRIHGKSKYGIERILKGFLDLITIKFLILYKKSPLHIFGGIGLLLGALGTLISAYLLFSWITGASIGNRPLLLLGILLILMGAQFFSLGLIGELVTNSRNNDDYIINFETHEL